MFSHMFNNVYIILKYLYSLMSLDGRQFSFSSSEDTEAQDIILGWRTRKWYSQCLNAVI